MTGILTWFAKNSVAANLLMWLIIIAGLLSAGAIRTQVIADLTYEIVTVSVPYPGAGPAEVDQEVCVRLDENLQGLKSIRRVHTTAVEGLCYVQVHLVRGAEVRQGLDDVKARIDAIDSFPGDIEEPVVEVFDPPSPILNLALSGRADRGTLQRLGERVRDDIAALPGITLTTLSGVRPYEISIEVSEEVLRRYGLSFQQVADAVRRSSVDLPGGSVKTKDAEILLRTHGQAYSGAEFADLVLISRDDGTRLTVGEVADISDGFAETVEEVHLNGEPAVLVNVFRVGHQDLKRSAERVKAYLDQLRPSLPEGIRATIWTDRTDWVKDRLGTMFANGRDGLVLVLVVLTLFLRLRLAGWVSVGIGVSFLGTLGAMLALGQTLSLASLVGFIIAIGIVVDDALVVAENIYSHHQKGREGLDAAVVGVREVAGPVFFSVATTITAFAPMLLLPGIVGQLFRALTIVVILCLVFSLLESLLILPSHLVHLPAARSTGTAARRSTWEPARDVLRTLFDRLAKRWYLPVLRRALGWRAATLATALALFLISLGLVAGGRVRFFFFQPYESDFIAVALTLPQGTPVEVTVAAVRHLEEKAEELRRQVAEEGEPDAWRHVLTEIGALPEVGIQFSDPARLAIRGSHLGGITIELASASERNVTTQDLAHRLRQLVGEIPDTVDLSFSSARLDAGKAIDFELSGTDLDELRMAAAELKAVLDGHPGVYGAADSLRTGKREIRLSVTPQAEALGIDLAELSRQVRQAFYGEEVQRLQRGRHELKVMVRYPAHERRLLTSLENMRIRTARGDEVPFAVAGRIQYRRSFAAIERTDGRWTVRVNADVDRTRANSNEIIQDLRRTALSELRRDYAGLNYSLAGEQQEQRETLGALLRYTFLALFSIYGLLAVATGSYVQPLICMGAIPFGLVGAIWGHLLMGFPLTIWSLVGVVALSGVVVNDSLLLISFANRAYRTGTPLDEAIRQAGEARLRPILLTSITTFAGLVPLLFERSVQAQDLIPIGISLAFGVLFATLISLLLVPVAYSLLEEAKRVILRRLPDTGSGHV